MDTLEYIYTLECIIRESRLLYCIFFISRGYSTVQYCITVLYSVLDGRVLVPGDMLSAEKRFFIKLLLAEGREVAIVDRNGTLRVPHFDEIVTPPDTPPDVPRVGVVRKRDNQSKKGEEKSEKKGEKKHRR